MYKVVGAEKQVIDLPRPDRLLMSLNDENISKIEKLVFENYQTNLKKLYQLVITFLLLCHIVFSLLPLTL